MTARTSGPAPTRPPDRLTATKSARNLFLLAWMTSSMLIRRHGPRRPGVPVGVVVYTIAITAGRAIALR
jgi:hypothetical protein